MSFKPKSYDEILKDLVASSLKMSGPLVRNPRMGTVVTDLLAGVIDAPDFTPIKLEADENGSWDVLEPSEPDESCGFDFRKELEKL